MSEPADAFPIPVHHLLAAAKLLVDNGAADWLSTKGLARHEAEQARLQDQSDRLNATRAAYQTEAVRRAGWA